MQGHVHRNKAHLIGQFACPDGSVLQLRPKSAHPHKSLDNTSSQPIIPQLRPPIAGDILTITMFLQRSAVAAARRAAVSPVVARTFTTSFVRRTHFAAPVQPMAIVV